MPIAPELMDPFHKRIYVKLQEVIESRKEQLANGGACTIPEDTATVAEKYAAKVAYLQALKDVLSMCEEADYEMHGVKKTEE